MNNVINFQIQTWLIEVYKLIYLSNWIVSKWKKEFSYQVLLYNKFFEEMVLMKDVFQLLSSLTIFFTFHDIRPIFLLFYVCEGKLLSFQL